MSTPTCARCGAPMRTLQQLAEIAVGARAALQRMRLALPTELTAGVRTLAASLPCHAGTCCAERRS